MLVAIKALHCTSVIANRMPAGTEVPAKNFLGAREDFLKI
jgi:hypothetical protein